MILAAAVPDGFAGAVADFGAGAGAAGLAVIARCASANTVLIEKSPQMADFARESIGLAQNTELSRRASVLEADVSRSGDARTRAGLADRSFDFVIMNPPFNSEADRATPDALKKEAHVMQAGLWDSWLRTAAAVLRPRGRMALIARPESLPEILTALEGRFGGAELMMIHPRQAGAAIRIVVRAALGSRKRLTVLPPLVLHGPTGNGFTERADAICNGLQSLYGD
ncbi:MAG: methyltransferase [Rhizobiaceae bacterium]|nr:methyltransferase [Rhizobiaceae bacterium]